MNWVIGIFLFLLLAIPISYYCNFLGIIVFGGIIGFIALIVSALKLNS